MFLAIIVTLASNVLDKADDHYSNWRWDITLSAGEKKTEKWRAYNLYRKMGADISITADCASHRGIGYQGCVKTDLVTEVEDFLADQ